MEKVSKYNPLHHYIWGNGCDGWDLTNESSLSVKQERMPSGTSEEMHYHNKSQQFFYILKGEAEFEIDGTFFKLNSGEGIHIKPGSRHRILNNSGSELEFLLCSQPSTAGDRINR